MPAKPQSQRQRTSALHLIAAPLRCHAVRVFSIALVLGPTGCLKSEEKPVAQPAPPADTVLKPTLSLRPPGPAAEPAQGAAGTPLTGTAGIESGIGEAEAGAPDQGGLLAAAKPAAGRQVKTAEMAAENPESARKAIPVADEPVFINEAAPPVSAMNDLVLKALKAMPKAGGYAVTREATSGLRLSILLDEKAGFAFDPAKAKPSFCSGATYQVFLKAVSLWSAKSRNAIDPTAMKLLLVAGQADGDGVWGRWNANGPGTARLFYETGLGVNFQSWQHAQPGDFMKVWWNEFVGKSERGHSVVFLGFDKAEDGSPGVRFWSSNQPDGYGEKVIPLTKAKRVLFSRLINPAAVNGIPAMPRRDKYLAEMLTRDSSMRELGQMTGLAMPNLGPEPEAAPAPKKQEPVPSKPPAPPTPAKKKKGLLSR